MLKHTLPLVGHRKPSNDAKRYTRRPLVVVYYSVDFSFDYRAGGDPSMSAVGLVGLGTRPQASVGWWSGACFIHGFKVICLLCCIATLSIFGRRELRAGSVPVRDEAAGPGLDQQGS